MSVHRMMKTAAEGLVLVGPAEWALEKAKKQALDELDFTNVFQAKTAAEMGWDKAFEVMNQKHIFWAAGETDCPRDIKAGNGELTTLRCKVCRVDSPKSFCLGEQEGKQ